MRYFILGVRYVLGYCKYCNQYFKYPKQRKLNTKYTEEGRNYLSSCNFCYKKTINYYSELWDTFYSEKI